MNCDALSLTGEREVLATAIYLIKQTIDTDTGVFATTLRNIYTLFLQADDLLQEFEATSQSPASAAAIATYVANELQGYRLKNVDIPMDQVDNLFEHLQNYTDNALEEIPLDKARASQLEPRLPSKYDAM